MGEDNKDRKNTFYISHKIEFLIWLIVILIFVAFHSVGYILREKNDESDYKVFMPDVDGLIVGSPVRMMGIDVGYVKKIKPVKNEVYVKFILTNPEVYIPQGSAVTVEFSGMAGSKSLEIYLPKEGEYIDKNTQVLTVDSPKRLRDALVLLDNMYKKLTSIIYTSSSFGEKLNDANLKIEKKSGKGGDFKELIKFSNKFLDDSEEKAVDMRDKIEGVLKRWN